MTAPKRPLGPVIVGGQPMPWGKGVIANGFVFLSGLEGRVDDDGRPVGGITAQTQLALERGRRYLEEVDCTLEHVVRLIQYLADAALFDEFHEARDGYLAEHAPQLLAEQSYGGVLVVQQFTKPDRLVEFELTAVLGEVPA